jgi:RNA polymerase sigma-70 factor, ECF subfamily
VIRFPLTSSSADTFVADQAGRSPMNEVAFLDFYARTTGPLGGYLRRLTGNRATAEDLLQDAYLRFLGVPRVPDDEAHRRNYLFRIATNLARDHFRRERRFTSSDDAEMRVAEGTSPAMDAGGDVWVVLDRVTPRDRELLLLAYVEGMTHLEIAQVTGLMRASIKPLLFRARRRFAAALTAAGLASSTTSVTPLVRS